MRSGCFFAAVYVLCAAGCASVSVRDVSELGAGAGTPPERIYIEDFEAPSSVFRVGRSGENLEKFIANFSGNLSENIAERVEKHLLPAEVVSRGSSLGAQPAWLVTGRFIRVNQGSRALRIVFGLGAGGSKVETRVNVYDLSGRSKRPILTFETTGGSNATPGAVFNTNIWLAGAGATGQAISGLSFDAVRTSREVTAMLSEYMAEQGLTDPDHALRSKKIGHWP